MPMQSQEQSTLNVKLVHFTKQNSPDEPVQVAFAVTDEQGKEEIITGEVPYTYDLFHLFQENNWLNLRRGVASIRENRGQRRAMAACSTPMVYALEPQFAWGSRSSQRNPGGGRIAGGILICWDHGSLCPAANRIGRFAGHRTTTLTHPGFETSPLPGGGPHRRLGTWRGA